MARFTIRVELHAATSADYSQLHERLARIGITDIIADDAGNRYKMPPGEYNYEGAATLEQVLASAQNSASQSNRKWAVFVTEALKRSWDGLPKI